MDTSDKQKTHSGLDDYLFDLMSDLSKEEKIALLEQLEHNRQTQDRRKYTRRSFFIEIDYADQDRVYRDFIQNISAGGLFIETQEPFMVGQEIKVNIGLPGLESPITIGGKIVWKKPEGVGVRFSHPIRYIRKLLEPKLGYIRRRIRPLERMKVFLSTGLPEPVLQRFLLGMSRLKHAARPLLRHRYAGNRHYCPVCHSRVSKFFPRYAPPRPDARCPVCGALERHRLDWFFLQTQTNLFDGSPKRLLHVAPEETVEAQFRNIPNLDYISVDLKDPRAMVKTDITRLPFVRHAFDIIYCSHVLEHVPDDRRAMREFYRVLKPGGWAVLQVPITASRTFEDFTITNPIERAKVFGRYDHVRRYGLDYAARLEEAGFQTRVFSAADLIEKGNDFSRLGVQRDRWVFYGQKTQEKQ